MKILKIFLILIWLEIFLHIGGVSFEFSQDLNNAAHLVKYNSYRIMCAGDSMTGFGTYPQELESALNRLQNKTSFSVINKGFPSGTTKDVLQKLPQWVDKYHPKMVIVMVGIDDPVGVSKNIVPNSSPEQPQAFFHPKIRIYNLVYSLFTQLRDLPRPEIQKAQLSYRILMAKCFPQDARVWYKFGLCYMSDGQYDRAVKCFDHILLIKDPKNLDRIRESDFEKMAYAYLRSGRDESGEHLLEWALERDHSFDILNVDIGASLIRRKKYQEAEKVFERYLRINNNTSDVLLRAYDSLVLIYTAEGKLDKIKELEKKMDALHHQDDNYQKIQDFLTSRGIRLAAAQYPFMDIKNLLNQFKPAADTIIIENRSNFLKVRTEFNYFDLFTDHATADFGHFTPQGARVMAAHAAEIILKALDK